MIVYVEKKVLEDPAIACDDNFGPVKKKFCTFREGVLQPPPPAVPLLSALGTWVPGGSDRCCSVLSASRL